MTRLWPTTHFPPTQQPTHGTHTQPAHTISTTTQSTAIRPHATPTQQTTHGDTRGPKAGCPQTHYQPAHTTHTHRKAA